MPIDGIGLQMHIFDLAPDGAGINANIARFTALGLQVHLTEMDVALPVDANGNASAEDLAIQTEIYREIASIWLAHPGCNAIQTRGFTNKYSWVGSATKKTKGAALLVERNCAPKPAYTAIMQAPAAGKRRKLSSFLLCDLRGKAVFSDSTCKNKDFNRKARKEDVTQTVSFLCVPSGCSLRTLRLKSC